MTKLERRFMAHWEQQTGLADRPQFQYRFHPDRLWRFDFAWPAAKLAVEIQGGIFVQGGHNRGAQITKDCDKHNAAIAQGWWLLLYTTKHLDKKNAPRTVAQIRQALELRSGGVRRHSLFR